MPNMPVSLKPNISAGIDLSYLALGDSYTIGESVLEIESFPFQVVAKLKNEGLNFNPPKIIAKTGWTTGELQGAISAEKLAPIYDVVTLLIGVNNQYRGASQVQYSEEFKILLNAAIGFARGNKERVFVISIPDWSVTPFGKSSEKDTDFISAEIDAFNAINKADTMAAGISYIEITTASRDADFDKSLIASDGLHPSAKMYESWALKITDAIKKALK